MEDSNRMFLHFTEIKAESKGKYWKKKDFHKRDEIKGGGESCLSAV